MAWLSRVAAPLCGSASRVYDAPKCWMAVSLFRRPRQPTTRAVPSGQLLRVAAQLHDSSGDSKDEAEAKMDKGSPTSKAALPTEQSAAAAAAAAQAAILPTEAQSALLLQVLMKDNLHLQADRERLQQRVDQLCEKLQQCTADLAAERAVSKQQIAHLERQLKDLKASTERLTASTERLIAENVALRLQVSQLQAELKELRAAFQTQASLSTQREAALRAEFHAKLAPLLELANRLDVRGAARHLEWFVCIEAAGSRAAAKQGKFNFVKLREANISLPEWLTPNVVDRIVYLKEQGNAAAHGTPFTKEALAAALAEDADNEAETAADAEIVARLEAFYKANGQAFGTLPE